MAPIETQTPICELVRGRPWVARILIAYGLDSGSQLPLARACQAQQLSLPELSLHLAQVWDGPDGLRQLSISQLLDYIVHCHHRYWRKVVPRLLAEAQAQAQRDPRYQSLCSELWELNREANPHMFREEMEVFPAIREMHIASQRAPHLARWIQRLEVEHSQALQHFLAFREALAAPEAAHSPEALPFLAGLAELDEDMRWHMYAENDLLFHHVRCSA